MRTYCCVLLLVALVQGAKGIQVEFSPDGFVEYQIPDPDKALNVIITSPHGGYLMPEGLPDRRGGCLQNNACVWQHDCETPTSACRVTTVLDTMSQEVTREIADELEEITGKRPYVVISLLSRRKADMNRNVDEATLNFLETVQAYQAFHGFIAASQATIRATPSGRGILFDIHSVGSHSENWLELGYRLSKTQLNNGAYTAADSSIANLAGDVCDTDLACFNQLLYGPDSFGGLLEVQGVKVIPSPTYTSPGTGGYYRGGYIVQTHGALQKQDMDAIQVEVPRPLRTEVTYLSTAKKIAAAIDEYVRVQYGS